MRLAEAVTATVAGWIVNPDTTVPESRAMMVGFSMVKVTVLYGFISCVQFQLRACCKLQAACEKRWIAFHDGKEIFVFRWMKSVIVQQKCNKKE